MKSAFKQSSSNSISSCNVYFEKISEDRFMHHAYGGGDGGAGGGEFAAGEKNGYTLEPTLRKCQRLQSFFKKQFK